MKEPDPQNDSMTEAGASPMVSIIVPSFNQGRFLQRCIDSILDQGHRPLEIVVVDGASTDETLDVLSSYADIPEVSWSSEPDGGPADAVNKGLARVRGPIVGIQSSDDYYLPGALELAVAAFRQDVNVGLIYGDVQSVDTEERVLRVWRRPPHRNDLCVALCICVPQSSAFFARELACELGGWRTTYHTADWDLWLRMMFRARTVKIDAVLSAWRVYPGQRTDQRQRVFSDFRRMLDESPDVRHGDWRTRQAARSAKQLIGVSYDNRGPWSRARYLVFAVALYPPVWRHIPGKRGMLPTSRGVWRSIMKRG